MNPVQNSLVVFIRDLLNNLKLDIADSHLAYSKEILRDFDSLLWRLDHEGLPFVTSTLPSLGKAILQSFRTGWLETPQGFRHKRGTSLPLFMSGLIVQGYENSGRLKDDAAPQAIRSLLQVCFLAYKLELPFTEEQIKRKVDGFLSAEKDLRCLNIDARDDVIQTAQAYVSEIFREFNPREIIPGHGPGAVATGEKNEGKWDFKRKFKNLHNYYPYYEYFVPSRQSLLRRVKWYKSLEDRDYAVSQVRFVPKDSRGPRIISMEESEVQFAQQGLKTALYDHLEKHPLTKGFINFTHQEINQQLALEGSRTGEWATLDMKEASDRVSLSVVKTLFHGTELLKALLAVRSQFAQLPSDAGEHAGKVVELMKYAPMGSAVCFPVEAVVFWALTKAIIAYERGELNVRNDVPVYVYGDDVILPKAYAEVVIRELPKYGLKVNADKSYFSGPFRESCGFDCFAGEVVTPIKLRKLWPSKRASASLLRSFSDYHSGFAAAGYTKTSLYLESLPGLRQLSRTRLKGALAIRKDGLNPVKWIPDFQRWEERVTCLTSKKRKTKLKGDNRLFANVTGRFVPQYEDPHASNCNMRWVCCYDTTPEHFRLTEGKPLPSSFGGHHWNRLEWKVKLSLAGEWNNRINACPGID